MRNNTISCLMIAQKPMWLKFLLYIYFDSFCYYAVHSIFPPLTRQIYFKEVEHRHMSNYVISSLVAIFISILHTFWRSSTFFTNHALLFFILYQLDSNFLQTMILLKFKYDYHRLFVKWDLEENYTMANLLDQHTSSHVHSPCLVTFIFNGLI